MKNLIVLKLGGSVITDKHSKQPTARHDVLARLAAEIAAAKPQSLTIIHGAGSYGHQIVARTGIDKGIKTPEQLLAFAETQRLQNELNCIVTGALIKAGIPAIPCQASAHALMEKGRLVHIDLVAVKRLLELGLVPVLYGVPAYDTAQGCSILSGDQIATHIAKSLGASRLIFGTDVDGIFTADPRKDPTARLIPEISSANIGQIMAALSGSATVDITGGMLGKVRELLAAGVSGQICNALVAGNIAAALAGQPVGTVIRAQRPLTGSACLY